jgi:hypothetical protein
MPQPTPENTMNLSEFRKRFVKRKTQKQVAEMKKYNESLQELLRNAGSRAKATPILNEQPCGCHDDPTYGHVIMAGCPLHD